MQKKWLWLLLGSVFVIPIGGFAHNTIIDPYTGSLIEYEQLVQTQIAPFKNLYLQPEEKALSASSASWKQYKSKLHSLSAFHFSDSVQIGFHKIKCSASRLQKNELTDINSHLAPKPARVATARGYGIQVKMEMD